ncbi:Uma2 family endonuclease [Altericista sp. CCNU0014]|uniref:Uma2 family endonuclease n=1 Tax=Altericista sp. CCNU0014 TaxID=3082949 RepID=UPI003850258B
MVVQIPVKRIDVPPGQHVLLHGVSWQEFEAILEDLGDHRGSRLAYDKGVLEITMPLPEHEYDKEIVGDLLKALLEELDIEFLTLGSTTFKDPDLQQGLEPDQCFYIQNEARVRGKKRLDLAIDPPPDLALEIDVTSRTHPDLYQALKVPELWCFDRGVLLIAVLRDGKYVEVSESPIFPGLPLIEAIPQYLAHSKTAGRNATLKAFRHWVRGDAKRT